MSYLCQFYASEPGKGWGITSWVLAVLWKESQLIEEEAASIEVRSLVVEEVSSVVYRVDESKSLSIS